METSNKIFLWLVALSVVVVILSTAYKFTLQKNYDFVVEASCDPTSEVCFYRDCNEEECPPNGLEYYKTMLVSAADFSKCSDNSCTIQCTENKISCQEVVCGESENDTCFSNPTQ